MAARRSTGCSTGSRPKPRRGGFPAIVAAPAALIDPVAARIHDPAVELLVDADAGRARRRAGAGAGRARPDAARLSRYLRASRARARLRQLRDEVSRIAATLARLSTGPDGARRRAPGRAAAATCPPVSLDTVRAGDPRAAAARALFRRGAVRRSGLGHAARPAPGRDRPASRAGVVAVHRRGGPGDDRAALDQDDDRRRPVRAPRRPPRRPPRVRRAVAQPRATAMRRYFAEVGKVGGGLVPP